MRARPMLLLLLGALLLDARPAQGIPLFARRYGVSCSQCHVSPPKLNEFGEAFVARGYEIPGMRSRGTWPFALWVSGRSESLPIPDDMQDRLKAYMNRIELIAGGRLGPNASYFVEWRALSKEARANGTLRDRSGRFEDLFVTYAPARAELTVGQFRLLQQVDVSRRVGLAEPLVFSASLPAAPSGGTSREQSLRSFSPAGRSPAVRVAWNQPFGLGWRWTTSAALAVPGEFSIPLSDSAKVEASNEIEWRAKGVMLESYVRRGLASYGGHVFYDDARRYLAQLVATGNQRNLHWGVTAGAAKTGDLVAGRWSLEGEYFPSYHLALGSRVEDRAADGARAALVPYVNFHFPGTRYTFRFTVERRFQKDRNATALEIGTVF